MPTHRRMRYDGIVVEFVIPFGRSPVHASARDQTFDLEARMVAAAVIDIVNDQLRAAPASERVGPYDVPGRSRPRKPTTLAANSKSEFRRIDLIPDLLPSDMTRAKIAAA
jgi:hypothetical protein